MINVVYMTHSELESDLAAENQRLEMVTAEPVRIGEVVRSSDVVTFDSFRPNKRLDLVMSPQAPDQSLLEVGSRVLLLRRIHANTPGEYSFRVMIVLGRDRDTVDGYVFFRAGSEYVRASVDISQVFDCISALGEGESDLTGFTDEQIPF